MKLKMPKEGIALPDKYRSAIIALLFLVFANCAFGQTYTYQKPTVDAKTEKRLNIDSVLLGPTICGTPSALNRIDSAKNKVAFVFDSCNHRLWVYDPKLKAWDSLHLGVTSSSGGGSGGGIVSLGNIGNLCLTLVNDSTYRVDTACLAALFLRRADSASAYVTLKRLADSMATVTNIYKANGTLISDRTIDGNTKFLQINNLADLFLEANNNAIIGGLGTGNLLYGPDWAIQNKLYLQNPTAGAGNKMLNYSTITDEVTYTDLPTDSINSKWSKLGDIGTGGTGKLGTKDNQKFSLITNDISRIEIESDGRILSYNSIAVGNGVTPSNYGYILDLLQGGTVNARVATTTDGSSGGRAILNFTAGIGSASTLPGWRLGLNTSAGGNNDFTFDELNSGSFVQRWKVQDGTGYFGINKTSPAFRLHVGGMGQFDSTLWITTEPFGDSTDKAASTAYVKQLAASLPGGGGSGGGIVSLGIVGNYGLTRINDSTYMVDTLAISTKAWRQKGIDSVAALLLAKQDTVKQIGTWVNEAFASSPSGWTSYAYSPSFSSGMVLPANGGTVFSGFAYMNSQYTASLNYSQQAEIILTTLGPINSGGVMIGRRSANPVHGCQNEFIFRMTGANTGKIYFYTVYNSTETLQDSSLEITVNAGDTIRIYAALSQTNAYARVAKLTAGKETETAALNYKYSPLAADLQQPANTGAVWMAGLGASGSYKCYSYLEKHYENPLSKLLIVGNSIATRYDASNLPSHWSRLAFDKVGFSNTSGGGDRFVEGLLRTSEIRLFNSQYVLFEYGTNDAASDFRTYGVPFIDSIQAMGKTPIWLKMFNTTAKDTVAYNISREQNIRLVDCGRANIPTPNNGAHYTDDGNQAVAYILQSELADIIGYTGGNELIKQTVEIDAGTTTINDGLNNRLVYQDNSGKFNVSNNLYWTESTGKLGIGVLPTGRFDVGTTLRIQGFEAPASGEGMEMLYNSSQGYIYAYDRTGNNYRDVIIGQGGNQIFVKGSSSRVGINNSSPDSTFDITGSLRATTGVRFSGLPTGPAAKRVMADANGSLYLSDSLGALIGAVPLSSITAATGSNTINNANNAQNWQWNSLTGGNAMTFSSSSTAKTGSASLLNSFVSGALATAGISTYAGYFSNSHTGTSLSNIAGRFSASGGTTNTAGYFNATGSATTNIAGSFISTDATNNYAIIVPASSGSVGIGNSAPTSLLHVSGSFATGYVAKTANYTATIDDHTINCTANTFQVTLPTAVGIAGRLYVITNSGAGTITVGTTSSETFANVVATPTTLTMAAVGSRTVQSDGANWLLLSSL